MTARRILLAAWLVFALYAYPGYLTAAAVDQLVDSHVGAMTDWHPTMMSELWRLLGFVIAGPAPMLAVQSGLLLAGSYALLRRTLTDRAAAIAAGCVLLAPPVMAGMAVVCAESQLVGFFVAGVACITTGSRRAQLAGLVLLVQAVAMHPAAAYAALPAIVLGLVVRAGWQRFALAAAAWVAVVALALAGNAVLVDTHTARGDGVHYVLHGHSAGEGLRDLGFHRHKTWRPDYTSFLPDKSLRDAAGTIARHSAVQRLLIVVVRLFRVLCRPYLFALLALVVLPFSIRRREHTATVLCAVALAHAVGLLATTVAADYRAAVLLEVCALLGAIVLAYATRARAARPAAAPAPAPPAE